MKEEYWLGTEVCTLCHGHYGHMDKKLEMVPCVSLCTPCDQVDICLDCLSVLHKALLRWTQGRMGQRKT